MYCIGYCTGCIFLYKKQHLAAVMVFWSSWALLGPKLGEGGFIPRGGQRPRSLDCWTAGVTTKEIDGALVLGTNVLGTKSAKKRHRNWAAKVKAPPTSLFARCCRFAFCFTRVVALVTPAVKYKSITRSGQRVSSLLQRSRDQYHGMTLCNTMSAISKAMRSSTPGPPAIKKKRYPLKWLPLY